jgi:Zn ribbon nucleic-acid-binding protein
MESSHIRQVLPDDAKVGHPCPYCIESGHTGVWNEKEQRFFVCMVCGDCGRLDKTAIAMYGKEQA